MDERYTPATLVGVSSKFAILVSYFWLILSKNTYKLAYRYHRDHHRGISNFGVLSSMIFLFEHHYCRLMSSYCRRSTLTVSEEVLVRKYFSRKWATARWLAIHGGATDLARGSRVDTISPGHCTVSPSSVLSRRWRRFHSEFIPATSDAHLPRVFNCSLLLLRPQRT